MLLDEDPRSRRGDSPRPGGPARGSRSGHLSLANETVISRVKEIVDEGDEPSLVGYLRGEVAQTFVDMVHEVCLYIPSLPERMLIVFAHFGFYLSLQTNQALGNPRLPPRLRREYLSALCRICGCLALLPRPLQILVHYDRWSTPLYNGGCADVWKGEYKDRPVAVKVMRVYLTSDLDKIRRVRRSRNALNPIPTI